MRTLRDPATERLVSFSAALTLIPVARSAGAIPKTRPVTVVTPRSTSRYVHELLRAEGATVLVHGEAWDETDRFARDLAGAINRLMSDAGLRARMGAAGRRRAVAEFSWSSIADQTVALYRSLASS